MKTCQPNCRCFKLLVNKGNYLNKWVISYHKGTCYSYVFTIQDLFTLLSWLSLCCSNLLVLLLTIFPYLFLVIFIFLTNSFFWSGFVRVVTPAAGSKLIYAVDDPCVMHLSGITPCDSWVIILLSSSFLLRHQSSRDVSSGYINALSDIFQNINPLISFRS